MTPEIFATIISSAIFCAGVYMVVQSAWLDNYWLLCGGSVWLIVAAISWLAVLRNLWITPAGAFTVRLYSRLKSLTQCSVLSDAHSVVGVVGEGRVRPANTLTGSTKSESRNVNTATSSERYQRDLLSNLSPPLGFVSPHPNGHEPNGREQN